jgi:hypothetical protein
MTTELTPPPPPPPPFISGTNRPKKATKFIIFSHFYGKTPCVYPKAQRLFYTHFNKEEFCFRIAETSINFVANAT